MPSVAKLALEDGTEVFTSWEQSMRLLIAQGVQTFAEVGPGKVLCGLMRQIDRSKTCVNVADEASLQKALEQLAVKLNA